MYGNVLVVHIQQLEFRQGKLPSYFQQRKSIAKRSGCSSSHGAIGLRECSLSIHQMGVDKSQHHWAYWLGNVRNSLRFQRLDRVNRRGSRSILCGFGWVSRWHWSRILCCMFSQSLLVRIGLPIHVFLELNLPNYHRTIRIYLHGFDAEQKLLRSNLSCHRSCVVRIHQHASGCHVQQDPSTFRGQKFHWKGSQEPKWSKP